MSNSTFARAVRGSVALGLLCCSPLAFGDKNPAPPADNTANNKTQAKGDTADQQSNAKSDVELAAQIRRAVMADKGLSTSAHNVKIIVTSGVVVLKGPVVSLAEKKNVCAKADQIAGSKNVRDQIEVAP